MANKRVWDFKLILAIVWGVFTSSMITWWWIWFLKMAKPINPEHRMFMWEGTILITVVVIGGVYLAVYAARDSRRHEKLKLFFSTFSHDIKTSITRLRLQSEVLEEEYETSKNPVLKRLLQDISRLDLQLENSLYLANIDDTRFYIENLKISQLLQSLRHDFSDLNLELSKDAELQTDRRAILSIIRNLLQNSILHGKADHVIVTVEQKTKTDIILTFSDNGLGYKGDLKKLGSEVLASKNSQSNGLGLSLCQRLIHKLGGTLSFSGTANSGFQAELTIQGQIL